MSWFDPGNYTKDSHFPEDFSQLLIYRMIDKIAFVNPSLVGYMISTLPSPTRLGLGSYGASLPRSSME
jgi:hypothetical protein